MEPVEGTAENDPGGDQSILTDPCRYIPDRAIPPRADIPVSDVDDDATDPDVGDVDVVGGTAADQKIKQ